MRSAGRSTDPQLAEEILGQPLARETSLMDLLRRPELGYLDIARLAGLDDPLDDYQSVRQLEIQARYSGYIERQVAEIEKLRKNNDTRIPDNMDYDNVLGLSAEVQQKLIETRPQTVGQASRIPGVTPAAVSLLLVHLKKIQRAA